LFQNKPDSKDKSPRIKPLNKHVRASLTRVEKGQEINATEEIFNWLVTENEQRNPDNIQSVVIIMDGQPSLWTAAGLFYNKHEEKLGFIEERVLRILQGKVKVVIRGLKQMATKRKLSKNKTEKLRKICNYLKKNQNRMQYHQYH